MIDSKQSCIQVWMQQYYVCYAPETTTPQCSSGLAACEMSWPVHWHDWTCTACPGLPSIALFQTLVFACTCHLLVHAFSVPEALSLPHTCSHP